MQHVVIVFPQTIISSEKYSKPIWMKPATQRLIKRKHRIHTKLLNTKSGIDKAEYKATRNQVTAQTRAYKIKRNGLVANIMKSVEVDEY